MVARRAVVTVFVRHGSGCPHDGKPFFRGCDCVKWLRYSGTACFCGSKHSGNQHRFTAGTRTWGLAEAKAQEIQRRLDAGETGAPLPAAPQSKLTVAQCIESFIRDKQVENRSEATIRKLRYQLGEFEKFLSERSKYFPAEITADDVRDYRASWTWGTLTRQKAQQNLRGFLRSYCRADQLDDLLAVLKTITLSKADRVRLKPRPFSEKELKRLLEQIPKTFPDAQKAVKMTALIHCMVSTGLAIRDTVQLERDSIADGWLRIERQKTNRAVKQRLEAGLHRELLSVANGNPKYIFWNGASKPTSAVGTWQADLRDLMSAAGLWIKGNLSHRFRDTAVDFWLGSGCDIPQIAAMLGDTPAIVAKHYADLLSKRFEDERLAKVPSRSWSAHV
jgi:site-specific recombinase XerD